MDENEKQLFLLERRIAQYESMGKKFSLNWRLQIVVSLVGLGHLYFPQQAVEFALAIKLPGTVLDAVVPIFLPFLFVKWGNFVFLYSQLRREIERTVCESIFEEKDSSRTDVLHLFDVMFVFDLIYRFQYYSTKGSEKVVRVLAAVFVSTIVGLNLALPFVFISRNEWLPVSVRVAAIATLLLLQLACYRQFHVAMKGREVFRWTSHGCFAFFLVFVFSLPLMIE